MRHISVAHSWSCRYCSPSFMSQQVPVCFRTKFARRSQGVSLLSSLRVATSSYVECDYEATLGIPYSFTLLQSAMWAIPIDGFSEKVIPPVCHDYSLIEQEVFPKTTTLVSYELTASVAVHLRVTKQRRSTGPAFSELCTCVGQIMITEIVNLL